MESDRFLQVAGDRFVDAAGRTVVLRGYNIGGFLNMENFLTGFPSTESLQRGALARALGPERCKRFFDRFMSAFFGDDDARFIASLGMNHVRLPVNYLHFEDDDRPFELKEEGFRLVDEVVAACDRHGLYVIVDLHALPGCQNMDWHSNNPTHHAHFWTHRHFQDRVVNLWEALARRYRGNPAVAGYNLMNEPGDATGEKIAPVCDRIAAAIRAVDPDHILFLDGNRYGTDFTPFEGRVPAPNTVYSAHDYKTPGMVYGGPYPGVTRGVFVDRAHVERTFLERTAYMRKTATPVWIGEFGPVFTNDPARDEDKYRLLSDQLDLYESHGASWAIWAYKDIGGEGLVYAAPDSAWLGRIAPVVAKKIRLGVDSWATTDASIRHIMAPIEETFAKEYPAFEPFPFGQQRWIQTLVRAILLAEPMVADFEACFAGVDDAAAIELADSFRFDRCVRRQPLAELIASKIASSSLR
ncbi:MAG TPA: glycoside hydrolase family 5 protein [Ramlibacter sp.]|uniref:glycoside hydrolase family 5 protein n=1 Tax=Ramlibacter sp. TaxID=1917967 RepID=UPI002B9B2950|nr:glycoside hydrolase family 5 protein [Ramlibacter sp.]HVZ45845.1 glycoside hydrolase family 5 protein [Ramlibacter sp.]